MKKSMPDLSEQPLQPWLALLAKDALADWRSELLRLFIRLLPSADLPSLTGLSREKLLDSLHDTKDATALLEAIVHQNEHSCTETVLQHFSSDFRHAIRQTKERTSFLTLFARATKTFFQKRLERQAGKLPQTITLPGKGFLRASWPSGRRKAFRSSSCGGSWAGS